MVFYKKKSYCRTTHKSRAAAFELAKAELSTENARLAYQLSRGESRYQRQDYRDGAKSPIGK
jgi:hypothetical protein